MDYSQPGSSVPGDSPGKTTAVGCHVLLQGIFPIQGSNPETKKKKKKKKINFLGKTTQVLRDLRKYVCQNNTGDVNNDIPLTFVT